MAEESGQSLDALQARRDAMRQRQCAVAEADRVLADAVSTAHAITVTALQGLDRIEGEVEAMVAAQADLALDTAAGARELQRFLMAKQHEIVAVVTDARDRAAVELAAVYGLRGSYRPMPE